MFFHSEVTFHFVTCPRFNLLLQKRKNYPEHQTKTKGFVMRFGQPELKGLFLFYFPLAAGGDNHPKENTASSLPLNQPVNHGIYYLPGCESQC